MEAFLRIDSADVLTLQLHARCFPLPSSNAFSVPTSSWRMKAIRPPHGSLTWVGEQRRSALIHVAALLNEGDGVDAGHWEDNWDAMDASHMKGLLWQALKRWGLPVAVGAIVGSVIARQKLIFVTSFSFLLFMAAHKFFEVQGGHLNSVSDVFSRESLYILLNTSNLITSRVVLYLPVVGMACSVCLRRITMHIHLLVASTWTCLGALVANKQGFLRARRDSLALDDKLNATNPASESKRNAIIFDIDACIKKVEGVMQTETGLSHMHSDTMWNVLLDNLSLLKAMVANVPVNGETHAQNALTRLSSTVDRSMKPRKRTRKHVDGDRVQSNMGDMIDSNSTVHHLEEDSVREKSSSLHAVEKIEDKFSWHASRETDKDVLHAVTAQASNGALLDKEWGLHLPDLSREASSTSPAGLLDVMDTLRAGESGSGNGNASKAKYVDYWTQHDQNTSESPSRSSEQKNRGHGFSSDHGKEGLFMPGDKVMQGEHDVHADKNNFWVEEPQLSVSIGNCDQANVSFTSFHCGNLTDQNAGGHQERHEPESTALHSKSHMLDSLITFESIDAESAFPTREKTTSLSDESGSKSESLEERYSRFQNGQSSSRLEQKATQHGVNGTNHTNIALEPKISLLGSTKELTFVRENSDMHVLSGFSGRMNDEEFQRLMNEGEIELSNGKAGLLGKIEVGEAESMLYKAADLFGSAAGLDSSSVEALGFWGNALLVHGELKLMLSRELRYMISTPDIISSYQIRRSRIDDMHDNGNRAAIQQAFQAVCEECEELLIQAGRKYRMALSISNSEIRALYNWGLALCFRAQLIAEEGGQNACEAADKVYLAAVDKFEAIMGISRRYAPGAMLNWGLILRDRSRLRSMNSVERIDLLLQARQLFQDALRLKPDDAQIQRASITCGVELKELQERKEFQSKRNTRTFFGNM